MASQHRKNRKREHINWERNKGKKGYVYLLENRPNNSIYKIGHTTRNDVDIRVREINSSGFYANRPANYFCIHKKQTLDCYTAEQAVHKELNNFRIERGYELFEFANEAHLEHAKSVIHRTCTELDDAINNANAREKDAMNRAAEKHKEQQRQDWLREQKAKQDAEKLKQEELQKNSKIVRCKGCGKENRIPLYLSSDRIPICGNCKLSLLTKSYEQPYQQKEEKRKSYTPPPEQKYESKHDYKQPVKNEYDDSFLLWAFAILGFITFVIWALNSEQKAKQPVTIVNPPVVNPVPAKPVEPPVDDWVQFREDWKKINEAKKAEEQKVPEGKPTEPVEKPKHKVKNGSKPKKKTLKQKNKWDCFKLQDDDALLKCVGLKK